MEGCSGRLHISGKSKHHDQSFGRVLICTALFSGEGELLFAPLTNLERMGNPWVKMHNDKPVVVMSVKVNSNQKSLRIEEILGSRKKTILAFVDNIAREIRFDLQLVSKNPFDELNFKNQPEFEVIKTKNEEWFNEDTNFKSALEIVLESERKQCVVQAFVEQELMLSVSSIHSRRQIYTLEAILSNLIQISSD